MELSDFTNSTVGTLSDKVSRGVLDTLNGAVGGLYRIDRPTVYNFLVEIDGILDSGFVTCSGVSSRLSGYKIEQCNQPQPSLIYDRYQTAPIKLTKGISWENSLEDWHFQVRNAYIGNRGGNDIYRRSVSVIQLYPLPPGIPIIGGSKIEMRRWHFIDCIPVDLTYPDYDATNASKISIMTVTIEPGELLEVTDYNREVGLLLNSLMK